MVTRSVSEETNITCSLAYASGYDRRQSGTVELGLAVLALATVDAEKTGASAQRLMQYTLIFNATKALVGQHPVRDHLQRLGIKRLFDVTVFVWQTGAGILK
jgi:hypothetical protein